MRSLKRCYNNELHFFFNSIISYFYITILLVTCSYYGGSNYYSFNKYVIKTYVNTVLIQRMALVHVYHTFAPKIKPHHAVHILANKCSIVFVLSTRVEIEIHFQSTNGYFNTLESTNRLQIKQIRMLEIFFPQKY